MLLAPQSVELVAGSGSDQLPASQKQGRQTGPYWFNVCRWLRPVSTACVLIFRLTTDHCSDGRRGVFGLFMVENPPETPAFRAVQAKSASRCYSPIAGPREPPAARVRGAHVQDDGGKRGELSTKTPPVGCFYRHLITGSQAFWGGGLSRSTVLWGFWAPNGR